MRALPSDILDLATNGIGELGTGVSGKTLDHDHEDRMWDILNPFQDDNVSWSFDGH